MSQKILFPTGFAELSEKARSNVIFLAEKLDAEIVAMHSIHPPSVITRLFSSYDKEEDRAAAVKQLMKFREKLGRETSVPVRSHLGEGAPEDAIVNAGKELRVDFIMFGTIGGDSLLDSLIGSAVNQVIRKAHCPVITFREKPAKPGFKRILVHLETLREAPELVVAAVKMALLMNAELHFLALMTGDPEHNIQLDNRVRNAVKYAHGHGIKVAEMHKEPLDRSVEEEIEDYAGRIHADLICVVTQSDDEKGMKNLLRGSVADRVVNMSRYPVMSVPPDRD